MESFSVLVMLKKSRNWRIFTAAFALTIVVGGFQLSQKYITEENCLNPVMAEVSWLTWLTGRSTSYRFHFLDLLELLSRNESRDNQSAL